MLVKRSNINRSKISRVNTNTLEPPAINKKEEEDKEEKQEVKVDEKVMD